MHAWLSLCQSGANRHSWTPEPSLLPGTWFSITFWKVLWNCSIKMASYRGWPRGRAVEFARSAAGGPVFRWFESWARTWHCSSNHAEAAFHMPQLEGPTSKNVQLCTGGLWGEKGKNKIFKKKKNGFISMLTACSYSSPSWKARGFPLLLALHSKSGSGSRGRLFCSITVLRKSSVVNEEGWKVQAFPELSLFDSSFLALFHPWTPNQLNQKSGGRPHGRILSSRTLLQRPELSLVRMLGTGMASLIRPCWGGIPHSTTRGTHS